MACGRCDPATDCLSTFFRGVYLVNLLVDICSLPRSYFQLDFATSVYIDAILYQTKFFIWWFLKFRHCVIFTFNDNIGGDFNQFPENEWDRWVAGARGRQRR